MESKKEDKIKKKAAKVEHGGKCLKDSDWELIQQVELLRKLEVCHLQGKEECFELASDAAIKVFVWISQLVNW